MLFGMACFTGNTMPHAAGQNGAMKSWRASLLWFDNDGQALYESDGLLVTGPGPAGCDVVIAIGSHAAHPTLCARCASVVEA